MNYSDYSLARPANKSCRTGKKIRGFCNGRNRYGYSGKVAAVLSKQDCGWISSSNLWQAVYHGDTEIPTVCGTYFRQEEMNFAFLLTIHCVWSGQNYLNFRISFLANQSSRRWNSCRCEIFADSISIVTSINPEEVGEDENDDDMPTSRGLICIKHNFPTSTSDER